MSHPRNVIARVAVAFDRRRPRRHTAATATGLPLLLPSSRGIIARTRAALSSQIGENGGVRIGGTIVDVGGPETTTTTAKAGEGATRRVVMLDFADPASAHGSKTTPELLRAIAVLRLCRLPFLVRHSETLLGLSARVLGRDVTDGLLRRTFFGHFCAGEDGDGARRVVERLGREHNVGPILDYAAEGGVDDGGTADVAEDDDAPPPPLPPADAAAFDRPAPARHSRASDEAGCDARASIFESCVRSAGDVPPSPAAGRGFAAIKVTALGDAAMLERMSSAIVGVRNLFGEFDAGGTGFIGRDEFVGCFE